MLEIKSPPARVDSPQRYNGPHRTGGQVVSSSRVAFPWILNSRKDLQYYIGSALAGWFYVGIIIFAVHTLKDPLRDPFATLNVVGFKIPLTLQLLVMMSWAFV